MCATAARAASIRLVAAPVVDNGALVIDDLIEGDDAGPAQFGEYLMHCEDRLPCQFGAVGFDAFFLEGGFLLPSSGRPAEPTSLGS